MSSVSVIVPVHNGGDAFQRCIAALAGALGPMDELVVVADGETDGTWRSLPPMQSTVQTVLNATPLGPAVARNRGAELASGEVLFFVDADVVVQPDTIERARTAFDAYPGLDALVGSYDDTPGDPAFLSQYRNLLHHYTHQVAGHQPADVGPYASLPTFWTGCGAVRRDRFRQLDGFDESYPVPCIEDIEFGYRLTDAGYRIGIDPELQVKHLKAWGASDMIRTDVFRRAAPWAELLLKRGTPENTLNVDQRSRLSVLTVGAMLTASVAVPFRPRLALSGVGLAACAFLGLNFSFYKYLADRRGLQFALRVLPWHMLYYGCSGAGFALALLRQTRNESAAASLSERTRD
ncbi:MAG: glycosyltransferase [Bacteroidota bacterium]